MFFITCFQKCELASDKFPKIGATRTFGYFPTKDLAEEALRSNSCDMYEYLYSYAVLEEIPEGIHPICNNRAFFRFDPDKNGYFPIEEPKIFEHYLNFALG